MTRQVEQLRQPQHEVAYRFLGCADLHGVRSDGRRWNRQRRQQQRGVPR
jgi:hypothetical protein